MQIRSVRVFTLVLAGLVATAATLPAQPVPLQAAPGQPAAVDTQALASAAELSVAFRNASRESLPAVVSITARTDARQRSTAQGNPLDDEMLRRFFGDSGALQQFNNQQSPPRQGQGSGFVIDPNGIIMTNAHVVNGADSVVVLFQDGTELAAESWHVDPWSDVAIVRVKPEQPLPSIAFGDSDAIEVGDWVLALGDPFGVGTSVTAGIISGKGRAPHINEREDFLQTDAAINPGNSGGPLVNLHGEVVGINTAISTRSGGYDGVGFAVPAQLAHWVADQLIANGKVTRAYLGVAAQPLTADLRRQFGVSNGTGALVAQVFPDSPAQKAGLKSGDVILQVNNVDVAHSVSLQGIVEALKIGESFPVKLVRDGSPMTLPVMMEQMPTEFSSRVPVRQTSHEGRRAPAKSNATDLGIEVSELTPDLRQSLQVADDLTGVVITSVDPAGPAAAKGVSRGAVVERVGTTSVSSIDEFNKALDASDMSRGVLLLLRQGGGTRFVVVTPKASA